MQEYVKLYLDGRWVTPNSSETHNVIDPATSEVAVRTVMANEQDAIAAINAAHNAFPSWSETSAQERHDLMLAIADEMDNRKDDLAAAISLTIGCPSDIAPWLQVDGAASRFRSYAKRAFYLEETEERNGFTVVKEPVGVCTLINPWNYPLSQFTGKVAPALAAGCTMIAKPAEQTPLQDIIMAEIFDKIGLPAGVFNLVLGKGSEIGAILCSHEKVDMVSFTGSTRAGRMISEAATPSIKRVTLELGGKSPYIATSDCDLEAAVKDCMSKVIINSGQSCNAPTRLLIPNSRYEEAVAFAKTAAEKAKVGNPEDSGVNLGPMSSHSQRNIVLSFIERGVAEGARLVTGGTEIPDGVNPKGAFVRPTVFADVNNNMTIAREEIFGPVACLIGYDTIDEAVEIANDTVYGLSSSVYAKDKEAAQTIARRIRAGQCFVQGAHFNGEAPFGGYKQSGNGREWGEEGLHEYCEIKSIIG